MTSRAAIDSFLAARTLAVVGVSRSATGFGRAAARELKRKGYRVFPVNREPGDLDGEAFYPSLKGLPEPVEAVLVVVPKTESAAVVKEAAEAGIRRVWLQQGSDSPEAVRIAGENGVALVSGECILMFARPAVWMHRAHHWLWTVLGKAPR